MRLSNCKFKPLNQQKFVFGITIALISAVLVTAYLCQLKFRSVLEQLEKEQYTVLFLDLQRTIELSLRLGAPVSALRNTQGALEYLRTQDKEIKNIIVFDEDGVIAFASNLVGSHQTVPAEWITLSRSSNLPVWNIETDAEIVTMGAGLKGAFNNLRGGLVLQFGKQKFVSTESVFSDTVVVIAMFCVFGGALLLTLHVRSILPRSKKFSPGIYFSTAILIVAASILIGIYTFRQFNENLQLEFQRQSTVVARTIVSQLERPLLAGIPLPDLFGVNEYLNDFLKSTLVGYIVITDKEGKSVFGTDCKNSPMGAKPKKDARFHEYQMPLRKHESIIGHIHVGVDKEKLSSRYFKTSFSADIILLATIIALCELALFPVGFALMRTVR